MIKEICVLVDKNSSIASLSYGSSAVVRCEARVGSGSVIAAEKKREGDGATPLGAHPLRKLFWRDDRLGSAQPKTFLPCRALTPNDGWCDDPKDKNYNRLVALPYTGGCENLWRKDALYNLIVVLGFNDNPPTPDGGSAIFLHCWRKDKTPTKGCVAIAEEELLKLIALCSAETNLIIAQR